MSNIDKEIESMAKSAQESVLTPKEILIETINDIGIEGVKDKLSTLTKSEKEVLNDALSDMKKAASPAMDDNYTVGYHKGDVYKDSVIQEDKADDDADEKLVKPKNAKMKNQGDNAPEGIEGQVIKAKTKESIDKEEAKAKKQLVDAVDNIADAEVDEHEVEMHKGRGPDKKQRKRRAGEGGDGVDETSFNSPKGVELAGNSNPGESVRGLKVREAQAAKLGNAAKRKAGRSWVEHAKEDSRQNLKDLKNMPKPKLTKAELIEMKDSIIKSYNDAGLPYTNELVKGKIKELLAEADQSKDNMDDMQNDKVRGDKSIPEDQNIGKENKAAQAKVNDNKQGQVKKSVEWADKNALLKSDRGGRNHHFSVNKYYDQVLSKSEENPKSKDLKKSEVNVKDYDLNDLIEKDMTTTWKELEDANGLAKSILETNGRLVKSFENNEIADALGLTEEEAKKILGE